MNEERNSGCQSY